MAHLLPRSSVPAGPAGAILAILATLVLGCGAGLAQDKPARTPSPPGARVYFIDIKEGQHLPGTFTVRFGLRGMGLAPAGIDKANTGHHHLIVDAPLPPPDVPVPNDPQHLHFGAGQTEADVTLTPGPHTLQLLFADKNHVPHDPPVASDVVHVVVDAAQPAAAESAPAVAPGGKHMPSPPGATVYFVYPKDGYVIYPTSTIRFGLSKMGVAPAGIDKPNTGHHHLLVDTDPPDPRSPIPNDPQHLHFGAGQTEVKLTLPEGQHTLQLVLGDQSHMLHDPPVVSDRITVTVRVGGPKRGK
jgi:hypothetical protein